MNSVDATINRVIDGMGSVPDCEVVQVCVTYNTTERIGTERFAAFWEALPLRQRTWAALLVEEATCPECGQVYQSGVAVNADGSIHRRCPYCGREW
jgi:predicted Zn-ribbon and HTH transcriptional regulator